METKNVIRADLFVIPNRAIAWEGSLGQEKAFDLGRWNYKQMVFNHNVGLDADSFIHEKFVECWFGTPGNSESNWNDHGIDGYHELKGWRIATNCLPESVFEGHKEGDVVTVEMPIIRKDWREGRDVEFIKVAVTLNQRGHRYREFGGFEDAVKQVTA